MINAKILHETLNYNPDTGEFKWLNPTGKRTPVGSRAGCVRPDGYIKLTINKKHYLAHRLAWLYMTGEFPKCVIDHINGNPSDNRFFNLRNASHSENSSNRGAQKNSSTGVKGVYFRKDCNKWQPLIKKNKKFFYLGLYETKEEAAKVYASAASLIHGNYARVA